MELKGKIKEIGDVQNISDSFTKRELILEYAENPHDPEFIKFEAMQDKTALLDMFKVGEEVEVFFNLRGRPWTNKQNVTSYFNTLVIWRINKLDGSNTQKAPTSSAPNVEIDDSNLPF